MKTLDEIFFPHEEALRNIFADHTVNSAQEALQLIVANQDKLTHDQKDILRDGLAAISHYKAGHGRLLGKGPVTTQAPDVNERIATEALLVDLAEPYARQGKDRVLGAAAGGPEAARYAKSYTPLTMDARAYLWGDEDMDSINEMRTKKLSELTDDEIEQIMNEHKEMVSVLYEHPEIAQYYPCVPATEQEKKEYPLTEALANTDRHHKQLWSEISELRKRNAHMTEQNDEKKNSA